MYINVLSKKKNLANVYKSAPYLNMLTSVGNLFLYHKMKVQCIKFH